MSGSGPPGWMEALLRRVVPEEDRDAITGDMAELYAVRERRQGRLRATLWYARNVVRFVVVLLLAGMRRDVRGTGGGIMGGWRTELIRAARRLRRAPVFTAVSVLTIGVGIGAFAAIYGVVESVLLEPPPYEEPDELLWIWRDYWFDLDRGWLGGPDIVMLREQEEAFEGVVAFRSNELNLTGRDGAAPQRVRATVATADVFDLLGVAPTLGRGFQPGEDTPGAPAVTVLGHELWTTAFGADPAVLGTDIYLNGEPTTVVGVAPEGLHFVVHSSLGSPSPEGDLWIPLRTDLAALSPNAGSFAGLARVREGASAAQVEAAIDAVGRQLDEIFGNRGLEMWGVGLKEDLVGGVRPALASLLGAATLLLLILGANLTALLLGRATRRDRELALLSALGAGRARMLQSLLSESVLLGLAGGAVGVGIAFAGADLIRSIAPTGLPRRMEIGVDSSVLTTAALVTLLMSLGAGLLPAGRALREAAAQRLREGGSRSGAGRTGSRTRSALVVVQVALSLVLLVSSGLITRAFVRLLTADPGFDGRDALTVTVTLDPNRYPEDADVVAFDSRFRAAVSALPGVERVGATDALPLTALAGQTGMRFPGAPGNTGVDEEDHPLIDYMAVTPGFMDAAGMRLLEGRRIDEADELEGAPVALIDDLLARRFFADGSALGSPLLIGDDTLTIVGVVDHARHYTVQADDRYQVYLPLALNATASLRYVVAGAGDPTRLVPDLRRILDGIDPTVPLTDAGTLRGLIEQSLGRERLSLTLLAVFAGAALLLAVLGIYGVVANQVTQRTHEMGVRMALGADRGGVLRLVLGQGARLTVWGTVLGLLAAVAASRVLVGVVAGVDPRDPLVYAGVALTLAAVTLLAAWVPARRAARIDPTEALRAE